MKYVEDIRAHFEKSLVDFEERLDGRLEKAAAEECGYEPIKLSKQERAAITEAMRALKKAVGLLGGLSDMALGILGLKQKPENWPKNLIEEDLATDLTMAMLASGGDSDTARKLSAEVERRKRLPPTETEGEEPADGYLAVPGQSVETTYVDYRGERSTTEPSCPFAGHEWKRAQSYSDSTTDRCIRCGAFRLERVPVTRTEYKAPKRERRRARITGGTG